MSSMDRAFNVTTLTNGTYIGIPLSATTAYVYSNFTAPTHSTSIAGEGSVFDYQSAGSQVVDSLLAYAGLCNALADPRAIAAGDLFRDMGDRYVFSANGYTAAVVSGVQPLTNSNYEGAENKMYLTSWVAQTLGTSNETVIGVAKL